jgi:hypothetical protein
VNFGPNKSITDEGVIGDAFDYLKLCGNKIVLDEEIIIIPPDIELEIISSIDLYYRYANISIGNHSRVVVALGGMGSIEHGIPSAPYGFLQIWYTSDGTLFSHDYLKTYPH